MAEELPGGPEGWRINRLIFRDWWHWKDHELQAALGNMALTGQNEGGKSSLLALAATLLDGDTAPRRLDPTLSPDRYLYYFLLGRDHDDPEIPGVFAYRSRVGYVAMEFRRGRDGRHLTVGMGVDASQAVQGKIREWWGFIIPDRRFGYDFEVRGKDGLCLGLNDFRQLPGLSKVVDGEGDVPPNAAVVTTKRHIYRQQVNDHLFKMDDDHYRALIESLVSARRPKIIQATQEGPEKVCELLRDSLPPLPGDQMDNLSAVINNLEIHQRNLKELEEQASMVEGIDRRHYALVEVLVQQAAQEYASQLGAYGNIMMRLQKFEKQRDEARRAVIALEDEIKVKKAAKALSEAELAAQRVDVADLPERIKQAQIRSQSAANYHRTVGENLDHISKEIEGAKKDLSRINKDFEEERRRTANRLDRQAGTARRLGWAEVAEMLQRAQDNTLTLDPAGPLDRIQAAAPDSACLIVKIEEGVAKCNIVRDRLKIRAEKEQEFQKQDRELKKLRDDRDKAVDAATRAEGRFLEGKDLLVEALEEWQAGFPDLELPDHRLAAVRSMVLDLKEVPEQGHLVLIEPIRSHAADRRAELQARRQTLLTRAERAGREVERLAGEIVDLSEKGLHPPRTVVREAARTFNGRVRALYQWVRFRPGLDPGLEDLVEAALLEAGVLDLVVPTADSPQADAWVWAAQPVSGPSLAGVLEPEEGAPQLVAAALAAFGWGEGKGNHWVAPDGRWRHGVAEGQVGPWLREPYGLVGSDRRRRALAGRINRLEESKRAAELDRVEALAGDGLCRDALETVDRALIELDRLSWQALFRAFYDLESARTAAETAKQALENAKPLAEAARQEFESTHRLYLEAVGESPGTRGLNESGLDSLVDQLKEFALDIRKLTGAYEGLERLMKEYHRKMDQLKRQEGSYRLWKDQQESVKQEYEAARAEVSALQQRAQSPDVAAALAARRRLEDEIDRLQGEIEKAGKEKTEQEGLQRAADLLVQELEPQARTARQLRDEKRSFLLYRLSLHPDFVEEARRLAAEADHKPGTLQLLPRLVENLPDLNDEIDTRRTELIRWMQKVAEDLADYRPTHSGTYDRITFFDEARQELTPRDLYDRLVDRQEKTRSLIDLEERNLYEEIICNDLLDDLIDLMAEAQDFRKKMNRKLERLRASSGAYFSFKLELRDESVPGVRVGRALAELDRGVSWLTGDHRHHLAKLIREEVERARQEARSQNRDIGYLEAIQATLDYRLWYVFKLFSQAPGQKPDQIKNRGFGTRSMFGRSWSLAVPIIAGVAARYDAARDPDVPRIVFLDEVFAGFDPQNRETYLRYLNELNLNWMITCPEDMPYSSQMPAVMSYQLHLSGTVHTAYPTLWDGRKVTDPSELVGMVMLRDVAGRKQEVGT